MEYKLLSIRGEAETNIGDYIQALASSQFYPHVDGFVNREELKSYDGEECKMIMNGWYMHHPEQWPPSNKIHPLFVAVHFNSLAKDALFSDESIAYLKRHEPIGCRDRFTCDMLTERGVRAYFSGCMTLTLGYKYGIGAANVNKAKPGGVNRSSKVYFVDAYFVTRWSVAAVLRNAFYLACHWRPISVIAKKHPETKRGLRKKMILTTFYREYRRYFSKQTLTDAEYICQQSARYKDCFPTDEARLKEAERLVRKYAEAKLVVTSRIHCALPCLGLETPVIYVEDAQQSEASACRMAGLRELFNILKWDRDHLEKAFDAPDTLDDTSKWRNKDSWRALADKLKDNCTAFINRA